MCQRMIDCLIQPVCVCVSRLGVRDGTNSDDWVVAAMVLVAVVVMVLLHTTSYK